MKKPLYSAERELLEVIEKQRRLDPDLIEQMVKIGKSLIIAREQESNGQLTMHFHGGIVKQREWRVFERV